jgi:hypothetical protein
VLQGVRTKRGLIDVLRYGLAYLCGTADATVVKRLTAVCDELHAFEAQMVHVADKQLTYLRTLDEMVKQNTRDTIDLSRV